MKQAEIDRNWLPKVQVVVIHWGPIETDLVDDETGCVFYTTPSSSLLALERAIAFCRRHSFIINEVKKFKEVCS